MANIPRIRAAGLWVPGSVVLQEEFEDFDEIRPWMINAETGSTHAPTVQIELGGQGLRISGPSRLDEITIGVLANGGLLTVADNSTLVVAGGAVGGLIRVDTGVVPGRIDLNGANSELRVKAGTFIKVKSAATATIEAGGSLNIAGNSQWQTGGSASVQTGVTWTLDVGATVNNSSAFYFATSTWPLLSPARSWIRRSLLIATLTYNTGLGGPPAFPNSWKIALAGAADQIETRSTISASDYTDVEFIGLPVGGTIATVDVTCVGNGPGTVGMSFPQYQIIRWRGASMGTMSALTADTHVLANWDITPITTTVTVTSNSTIDGEYRYGVRIYHAYYGGSPAGTGHFTDCIASGTASAIKL